MIDSINSSRGLRILTGAASFVIIVAGINLAQSVIVLFLVSFFLALLGTPPVLWLKDKRIPSGFAVFIVMAVMIIILTMISVQIGASFSSFLVELPLLQVRIQEQISELTVFLRSKGMEVNKNVFLEYINPESVMKFTVNLLSGLGSLLSDLVLILLTVGFILLEVSSFPVKLRAVLGDPEQVFPKLTKFATAMKRYMVIKTLISLATGILIAIWLTILNIDYAVLWGFLAFLLNYIPNIGSVVAAVPAVIMTIIQFGIGRAIIVLAGYFAINFIIGNILEPRLMGRRLGLSTLVVFISLIFWGGLLGLIGAILSIPLTMTMKFAFENNESTRWIAVMLGSEKPDEFSAPHSKKKK